MVLLMFSGIDCFVIFYPLYLSVHGKLIQKIKINEEKSEDPYISLIKDLALKDKMDFDTAKLLITEYKNIEKENK